MDSIINLTYAHQRADHKAEYTADGDVLIVKMGDLEEEFDFTGLPQGRAEGVTPEILSHNPIISAEKHGDVIDIEVIYFYSFEEKELYESGDN